HLGLHFPADLRDPEDVREVLMVASQLGGFRRRQIQACVILKMMHVINHMEAAELRFQTAMSEADLFDLADRRIKNAAEAMSSTGIPLVAFYGNRKSRNSVITKLLAKRETIATTVFDKQRYRVVTERKDQILPAIGWMTRNLFPFNYIIPGQSHNNLLEGVGIPEETGLKRALVESVPSAVGLDPNPFSGASYRQVNFVVDFPVRVDHMVEPRSVALLGRTVFILVEFQVLDRETARSNEEGENAHALYKERQRKKVGARLRKGGRSSSD
ncbi:MAG: TIGR04552 family protein, partial [Myxococcota bacterium]|nr:TIGR04552 family protein [Myxococcota bacterium]